MPAGPIVRCYLNGDQIGLACLQLGREAQAACHIIFGEQDAVLGIRQPNGIGVIVGHIATTLCGGGLWRQPQLQLGGLWCLEGIAAGRVTTALRAGDDGALVQCHGGSVNRLLRDRPGRDHGESFLPFGQSMGPFGGYNGGRLRLACGLLIFSLHGLEYVDNPVRCVFFRLRPTGGGQYQQASNK